MSKLVLLLVAVLVFFWLLRGALTRRKPRGGTPDGEAKGSAQPAPVLVACAHCGVLLPQDEAIASEAAGLAGDRRFFCTDEHARLGPR